jgi:hypothetical protein
MVPAQTSTFTASFAFTGFCSSTPSSMTIPNKSVLLAFASLFLAPASRGADLFDCIVMVENPGGVARGKLGEIGPAQIKPILIADINRIYGTKFTPGDAFSLEKSRLLFQLYTDHYIQYGNHADTAYNRALLWHYGPRGPRTHQDDPYASRVCALLAAHGPR